MADDRVSEERSLLVMARAGLTQRLADCRVSVEHSLLEMDLEKQLSTLQEAALEERSDFERIINEMSEKIQQLEDQEDNSEEAEE